MSALFHSLFCSSPLLISFHFLCLEEEKGRENSPTRKSYLRTADFHQLNIFYLATLHNRETEWNSFYFIFHFRFYFATFPSYIEIVLFTGRTSGSEKRFYFIVVLKCNLRDMLLLPVLVCFYFIRKFIWFPTHAFKVVFLVVYC